MNGKKYVYLFEDGSREMVDLLGGKGAGLSEMKKIGLEVPPGFTITTEACRDFLKTSKFPDGMLQQAMDALHVIEKQAGKKFGNTDNPLLVSVRSGAPVSMPGMMDTILNVGLNDKTVSGLSHMTSNPRFAWDSYRRLIQMFGSVVLGIKREEFEAEIESAKKGKGYRFDTEMDTTDLQALVEKFKGVYRKNGKDFPEDPQKQLVMAMEAVFRSWNSDRAVAYREINKLSSIAGTAVNVVSMIFGNMGNDSATGVAFTRDPNTGEKKLFAEYLINAQGEDVVSGARTPRSIDDMKHELPGAYESLIKAVNALEAHYRDMMDIEFTVEKGKLYMLQTRVGKRTASAAIKIAVDLVKEGLIKKEEAIMRITPETLSITLYPQVRKTHGMTPVGKGLAASPGAAVGSIVFSSQRAIDLAKEKKQLILVRPETTADDVRGMAASRGFLTQKGGMTSHAAVVARSMGKPAVVGAEAISVDPIKGSLTINGKVYREGDILTIDGTSGEFYEGEVPMESSQASTETELLLSWADEFRKLGIRANANTPEEATLARKNGARGIGLARTERMFLGSERIRIVRAMIMSETPQQRRTQLEKLKPMQVNDFVEFFRTMEGFPVIIRLLDPPLHEFLPDKEEILTQIHGIEKTEASGKKLSSAEEEKRTELQKLLTVVRDMQEFNPMLGFRGCRVGIVYPEIYEMQVRAIIEAAVRVKEEGKEIFPEIMIPLIGHTNELRVLRERLEPVAKEAMGKTEVKYEFGTMIEIPRACITADGVARYADFFSFGTNDLTQMTFGYSRDDAEGKFLASYIENGILTEDPFSSVDQEGVGELMKMAVEKGRSTRKNLSVGICGEQGGDPETIKFCHRIGLDYVSASPFRIPVARLSAAQAALEG
ncbi:MAG: pyruvate, phosphate dikinase [Thermoplasmataceae archaeon]